MALIILTAHQQPQRVDLCATKMFGTKYTYTRVIKSVATSDTNFKNLNHSSHLGIIQDESIQFTQQLRCKNLHKMFLIN